MKTIATVLTVLMLWSVPFMSSADDQQSQWPASIKGDKGFFELGKAIQAEPGFPRNGTDVEKAKYISGRLPEISKKYGLKAATESFWDNRVVMKWYRVKGWALEKVNWADPENAESLKGLSGKGNCGEFSWAFSEVLQGAGVVSKVVYGDSTPGKGFSDGFTGTDTTVIVEERTPNKEVSRRVFDPFRAAYHNNETRQPTDKTVADWSDMPLTDADRLPRDDTDGKNTWNTHIGKPFVKDGTTQQEVEPVPERFRPGSAANRSKQMKEKALADLASARAKIQEAREAAAGAEAKAHEAENACASSDQAVQAAESAKGALARAESFVVSAARVCSSAPSRGELETAGQAVSDAASQLQDLAARIQPFAEEACKIASMAAGMSDREPYKGLQVGNADAMAESARSLAGEAAQALSRAKENARRVFAADVQIKAARDQAQAAGGTLDSAREAATGAQSQLAASKSACDAAASLLAAANENAQRAEERKNSALKIANDVITNLIPGIEEPDKATILGMASSITGEAGSIAVSSVEGASNSVSRAQEQINSSLASLDPVLQRLGALEQSLAACDSLAPMDELYASAMAALTSAQGSAQEVRQSLAKAEKCSSKATAKADSKSDRKAEKTGEGGGEDVRKTDSRGSRRGEKGEQGAGGDKRRPDRGGGGEGEQPSGGGGGGSDLIDRYRQREEGRDEAVNRRRGPREPGTPEGGGRIPQEGQPPMNPDDLWWNRGQGRDRTGHGGSGHGSGGMSTGTRRSGSGGTSPQCRANTDCGSNQYCNKGTGKCVTCPPNQHPRRDGSPGCHSE